MKSNAFFSPCNKYRWSLTRYINESCKEIIFIGLNPSSADAIHNDSTLIRIIDFCESWGYGSLTVINLFAKIATNPRYLSVDNDPIGRDNDAALNKYINHWSQNKMCDLWIGWGIKGQLMNRDQEILKRIKKYSQRIPNIIGETKGGYPRHPLYISKKKTLYPLP